MPPITWLTDPVPLIQQFERKHANPEAGALLLFAVQTTESLAYLRDVDARDDLSRPTIGGHAPHTVDVAHARWAVGGCATTFDLCAAALGRALCAHAGKHELDLAAFDHTTTNKQRAAGAAMLRGALPAPALGWVDAVLGECDYAEIRALRNHLTHGRVTRHFSMPRKRLRLMGQGVLNDVPAWVAEAERLAVHHVSALVAVLPSV
jgi:hypothetical protein